MINFSKIAWQTNRYSHFNNFATVEVKNIFYQEQPITPKSVSDYGVTKLYSVKFCECQDENDRSDEETTCSDLSKCENVETYKCKILCLAGLLFNQDLKSNQ